MTRSTRFFSLPYDCGQRGVRMGAGPLHLAQILGVEAEEILPASTFPQEVRTSFELYRGLAARVAESDEFPVVFSGHCGASIGVAAGLRDPRLAVLWFDAHGDYNTPETTDTGFLDGMCLAVMTGRCWSNLAGTVPHFRPLDPRRVVHAGARDWSPGEREALVADGVRMLAPGGAVEAALEGLDAERILLHVDLDVIDAAYGRANHYAVGGGLSPDDVLRVIAGATSRMPAAALVLASYDPSCDQEGTIARIGAEIVQRVTAST
jgi:arginase